MITNATQRVPILLEKASGLEFKESIISPIKILTAGMEIPVRKPPKVPRNIKKWSNESALLKT
jgi:hypothetical protein